ncbi:DNA cytosine methyltransferase [Phaeobacter sp. S60]|uniref:DNA cytosine methyltransferase n=1 Tax=Phaeobacter sp. S60 TaxID=1569353 RepID=UPI00058D07C1|nr:DNA cytosine methyltransferase [Phaeobacter sp. S60]KII14329.1 multidrug DMT transporter [Phaeobacter sp. S60]
MLRSLELFAGAGGLALGTELAGFHSVAAVEKDKWACETLRQNKERGHPLVRNLRVISGDVRNIDYDSLPSDIDLVSGGPPCQPFSIGGKHQAHRDDRDMFSAFADVLSAVRPKAFIIENVKGLTRSSFTNYLHYIELRMSMPDIGMREDETWHDHLKRLAAEETSTGDKGLRYGVVRSLFNAADFGAPQKRERVFIVGFREDQDAKFEFPDETHSLDALLRDQWVTGEYWDRNQVAKKDIPAQPIRMKRRIERLRERNDISLSPWRTVREALQGLPEPRRDGRCPPGILDHRLQLGAKVYPGHTGSPIDLPAKALKAGDHGVPGGENMMVRPDGSVRYFTVRESARLQTFPDGYVFHGAWSETMRQLGNAVPVVLAQSVASEVAKHLLLAKGREIAKRKAH